MKKLIWSLTILIAPAAFAKYVRSLPDFWLQNAQVQAITGTQIYVLTQPADTASLSPQATLYGSSTGSGSANCGGIGGVITRPLITDGFGHACAHAARGVYTLVHVNPYTGTVIYPDQNWATLNSNFFCLLTGCTFTGPVIAPSFVGSLTGNDDNNVLVATTFAGADIGAKVKAAQATCSTACTIQIPPGVYTQTTSISISNPNVHLIGYGAELIASMGRNGVMVSLDGSGDSIEGATLELNGRATYGVVIGNSASDVRVVHTTFTGRGSYGVYASYAGSGLSVIDNTFEADSTGHGPGPMSIQFTNNFRVIGNHLKNTFGFGIPLIASSHGTISGNDIYEPAQKQTVVATSGQTSFTFTLPGVATRLSAQVAGVPTALASATNTSGNTWTATFASTPGSGAVVTFLGWQSLEDIQVNSYSTDNSITGNELNGTGDSGIDVVSDYHATTLQTITASNNQTVFNFTGDTVSFFAGVLVNGKLLSGAEVLNGGPVHTSTGNWTVTLATPQPSGTSVSLVNLRITTSTAADYPYGVTISGNNIRGANAACIASESGNNNIAIISNVLEDCGQGLPAGTPYSSGIFVIGATGLTVRDNTITNSLSVPTMQMGIGGLGFSDTGSLVKNAVIGGNTISGTFSGGQYWFPNSTPTMRQAGIDLDGVTIPYPEQVNIDSIRTSGLPTNTKYFAYSSNNATITKDTTNMLMGAASINISTVGDSSSSQFQINLQATQQFANSILKVTFWAKAISGTMNFQIWSQNVGIPKPVIIPISATSWQEYSLYLDTAGLTLGKGTVFIRISSSATSTANAVFSGFNISSTPLRPSQHGESLSNETTKQFHGRE